MKKKIMILTGAGQIGMAIARRMGLLSLDMLQPDTIKDTVHAYQMAKRCNVKRVMAEAVKWGERGAGINSISPGIIVTSLAIDEFNGPRGEFLQKHVRQMPGRTPRNRRRGCQCCRKPSCIVL